MAYAMTKQGSLDNCVTYEFICDAIEDMNAIEDRYRTIGTVAIVLSGASGLEVYIAGSDKQWNNLGAMGGSSSDSSAPSLAIHVCTSEEIDEGMPSIDTPDESQIYLVPSSEEEGNLYDEYIYVNDGWEKFGAARIDLSGYVVKNNAVIENSISMGRATNSVIGVNSTAFGGGVTASGDLSHAEGGGTIASGDQSHAEGSGARAIEVNAHAEGGGTTASGRDSHAEGSGTQAIGLGAHAEGGGTQATELNAHAEGSGTTASGAASHAEGGGASASGDTSHAEGNNTIASGNTAHVEGLLTIAAGSYSHVSGKYNTADNYDNWPEWTANTAYVVGDKVKITSETTVKGYICYTPNNDNIFTASHWTDAQGQMNYAEIIGNGSAVNERSNARALDWDGNEHLMGDIYVGCNADSTGGIKLPRIPEAPSTDGTYILQATVTNGTPTYSWVSAG